MVRICAVGDCKNRSAYMKCNEEHELRFSQFPTHKTDPERRKKWADLCGRKDPITGKAWKPKDSVKGVYICSKHFVLGKPSRLTTHPDYFPSLYLPGAPNTPRSGEKAVRRFESKARRSMANDPLFAVNLPKTNDDLDMDRDDFTDIQPLEESILPDIMEQEINLPIEGQDSLQPHDVSVQVDIGSYETQRQLEEKDQLIDKLQSQLESCQQELASLRSHNEYLQANVNTARFSSAIIYENDSKSRLYTGLSWKTFLALFTFLSQFVPQGGPQVCKSSHMDQLFYALVRLRHNDIFEKLGDHAGISKTTVIDYFWKWIDLIFIKCRFLIQWPERDLIHKINPPHFRMHFPKLTCIIDCFEIFIESAHNLKTRAQTYSTYKSHTTAKYLIGCNPLGAVIFLSKGWGGRASDIHIVKESGFIDSRYHHPGDQILADRGFTFRDEMASVCGAELIIPSFIMGKSQFSAQEVETSRQIASVRIHIERVIGLIKNRFAILQQTIPLRMVQSLKSECDMEDFSNLDKIVTSCAVLVNMEESIVYKEGSKGD